MDRKSDLPLRQIVPARMGDPQQGNPSNLQHAPQSVDEEVTSPRTLDSTAATSLVDTQHNEQLREYLDARKSPPAERSAVGETASGVTAHDEAMRSKHGNAPRRMSTRSDVPTDRGGANPRRHVVEAGDTLTRIAGEYYGSRSKRVTDAIFDANRATLPDADHLSVGMKIMLPRLEGLASSTSRSMNRAVFRK